MSLPKPDKSVIAKNTTGRWNTLPQYRMGKVEITTGAGSQPSPDAFLHYRNRGNAFQAQGNLDAAMESYRHALAIKPDSVELLCTIGFVLQAQGQLDQAIECCRRALLLKPDFVGAYGNLGLAFEAQGKLDQAIENYRKAVALKPTYADMHFNLGNVLKKQGKLDESIRSYRKALAINPNDAEAHYNMGNIFQDLGKLDEAVTSYHKALVLRPGYAEAHNNLGNTLQLQGRLSEAIQSYRKALALDASNAEAHNSLGTALKDQGRQEEAITCYRTALALRPDYVDAYGNLGSLFLAYGKLDEAIQNYRKVIELRPEYAEAYNNLGNPLHSQGKLSEAAACFSKAVELRPDFAEAYNNQGNVFLDQGKLDAAIASYRKAISIRPDYILAHDNLLMAITHHPDYSSEQYLAEAHRYGDLVAARAKPYAQWQVAPPGSEVLPSLRVGLVSGDFKSHPVGFFLEGMLAHLNPARIELVAYSTVPKEDALTVRIKPRFSAWNLVAGLSDEAVANKIHADGIHILIDMAGHTAHNGLPVFAWKPAPVQVSWLGYWASTGVSGMDYLLADRVSVPEHSQESFTESVFCLPDTRLCFTPPAESENFPVSALPQMRNGYITFGSFQKLGKMNEGVLALWGRVFRALPEARLRLQNRQMNCPVAREQLLSRLASFGINSERVTIEQETPRDGYLAAHADVDIILDTFPFPGGTTTCEALWMGVPTLTLAGDSLLGRQGAGLLNCVGLSDWVASSKDEYVNLAVSHATDMPRLEQLRADLRQKALDSPLFDGVRFAVNLENALQEMWQQTAPPGRGRE